MNIGTFDLTKIPFNESGNIQDLQKWINNMVSYGATGYRYSISWGLYDDIDSIEIVATTKETEKKMLKRMELEIFKTVGKSVTIKKPRKKIYVFQMDNEILIINNTYNTVTYQFLFNNILRVI